MKKKTVIILIIIAVVAVLLIFVILPMFSKDSEQKKADKKKLAKVKAADAPAEVPTLSEYDQYFPIKKGDRNKFVEIMQEAMISMYGAGILPQYGADGIYGDETEAGLKLKGLPTTVYLSTFYKLLSIKY